ncbi:hypothetical protein Tco_1507824 [Tanacetum coccineum]
MDPVTLCPNPSQPLKVGKTLFQNSQRYTHFYRLSHSELVGIEKVDPHGFEGTNKDGNGDFRYSDTVRPSQSDEVLKLKNFEKDASLQLSSYQIKKDAQVHIFTYKLKSKECAPAKQSRSLQHIHKMK